MSTTARTRVSNALSDDLILPREIARRVHDLTLATDADADLPLGE